MSELIHINIVRGYYVGQIRLYGHRKWESVSSERTAEKALAKAVLKMTREHKRARVLFVPTSGYYEPTVVMEAHR